MVETTPGRRRSHSLPLILPDEREGPATQRELRTPAALGAERNLWVADSSPSQRVLHKPNRLLDLRRIYPQMRAGAAALAVAGNQHAMGAQPCG